jgi:DNA-directed RNA polymerase subunit F
MKPKVISEEALSMADARRELRKVKKRDEELSFRANKTEEYLNELTQLSDKAAKELTKKLQELEIPRLKEEHIAKIVDLLPLTKEDLKAILSHYTITIKEDNIKSILAAVDEYRK